MSTRLASVHLASPSASCHRLPRVMGIFLARTAKPAGNDVRTFKAIKRIFHDINASLSIHRACALAFLPRFRLR